MKKWENSSRLDGSSAIVYSTMSSFTHDSSKLLFSPCQQRLWCVCTQEELKREPPELRGVWTLNVNGRRIIYSTLLCSLSVYLVQLIQYSSSPFGPFISSRNGIFGDGWRRLTACQSGSYDFSLFSQAVQFHSMRSLKNITDEFANSISLIFYILLYFVCMDYMTTYL